jgi:hypothetical protein
MLRLNVRRHGRHHHVAKHKEIQTRTLPQLWHQNRQRRASLDGVEIGSLEKLDHLPNQFRDALLVPRLRHGDAQLTVLREPRLHRRGSTINTPIDDTDDSNP